MAEGMLMSAGAPTQQGDPAAYWTRLLQDPAFRAMPPDQRTALLTRQVQAAQSQAHTESAGQDMALGQAVGAVKQGKAPPAQAEASTVHPLDAVIDDPKADHQAALMQYVYGP